MKEEPPNTALLLTACLRRGRRCRPLASGCLQQKPTLDMRSGASWVLTRRRLTTWESNDTLAMSLNRLSLIHGD